MKAVVIREYGDASQLSIHNVPSPTPQKNELLVRVKAVGVNRADILQRRGYYPPPAGDSDILGLEISGVVEDSGESVTGFQRGDRVFGLVGGGGYAEQAVIDYRMASPIPDNWDFVMAAAVPETFYTANESLFTLGRVAEGESVLIHAGGSGVGSIGIQMAAAAGAKVFATAGSPDKCAQCTMLGAQAAINYKLEDFVERIHEETQGQGAQVILDFIGAAYLKRNLQSLSHQGRLVLVGLLGGIKEEINLSMVISKRLQIMGSIMRSLSLEEKVQIKQRFEEQWYPQLLSRAVRPIIDQTFPLDHVIEAHQYMESNQHFGKIILEV